VTTLTVTLRQKAQVSDRARSDFVLGTADHLPGTVVRGAFAARWLTRHQYRTDQPGLRAEFLALFEGQVRYGPLFHTAAPAALSVLAHKYPASADCDHDDIDRAHTDFTGHHCPQCGSPLEQVKPGRGDGPATGRRVHVAISDTGVARRGQLVTRETLQPGLTFTGTVHTDDPALLDILRDLGHLRVGGRRTTHGLADVHLDQTRPVPLPLLREDGLLIVVLRSPGIFVDDAGRPQRDPNAGELDDLFGCPVTIHRRWTRWTTVGGWHTASGLPKPAELAVAAGSTYLLAPAIPPTQDTITRLTQRGLGLRRHEGFGDLGPPPPIRPGRLHRARPHTDQPSGTTPVADVPATGEAAP
jgi:CRISPR-associated protein Csx10